MEVAVLGGTQVQLVVPEKPDQFLAGNASKAYYEQILDIGVELYLYKEGILHAKTMTIDDDLTFFGTSNFDIRSFELNFEINLILYGRNPLLDIRHIQETYIDSSRKLTLDEWKKRPLYEETIQNVTKLFSPLL
jgi:cardiolipin synthase